MNYPIKRIEELTLKSLDGTKTFANSKQLFIQIPHFCEKWIDVPSNPTKKTKIEVYDIQSLTTHEEKFNSISRDLDSLCLTQHQIIEFCTNHQNLFCPQTKRNFMGTIYFIFKSDEDYKLLHPDDDYLVACICLTQGELLFDIDYIDLCRNIKFSNGKFRLFPSRFKSHKIIGNRNILSRFVVRKLKE